MAQSNSSKLVTNIKDLLDIYKAEGPTIEFKRSWNKGPTSWQVLKTICAFANDLLNDDGGYIIIGVDDKHTEGGDLQVHGVTGGELDKIQRQIVGLCKGCIKPEYQPRLSPELYEGKHLLVIWATASENGPHQCQASANGGFEYYIRRGSQTMKASQVEVSQLQQQHSRIPFDDRMAVDLDKGNQLTEEDVDVNLVKAFLREVGSKIEDQDLDNPIQLYENMRLVRSLGPKQQKGKLVKRFAPRNVTLLFFNQNPKKYFPGAITEIGIYDQNGNSIHEEKYEGPIDQQIKNTLEYILSEIKVKEEEPVAFVPYPRKALREAVVNAFYHRGYQPEHSDPVKVRIYPSHIDIISYPGPHPSLKPDHFMEDQEMPPVKTRNRRVGEFLKERKLAEDKGTGVRTIFRTMKTNGNFTPDFQFDDSYFRVRLPGHPKFMVRDILNEVNKLCASGETRSAVKQLRRFMEKNPDLTSSLVGKLLELCDNDKNHPDVQPFKDVISQRLEQRLSLISDLQKWSLSSPPQNISAGVAIIQDLVQKGADSDDLQMATQIAVKFCQFRYENTPEGTRGGLQANQNAHQLFQAMSDVTRSDAYIAFHFGCCKYNLYRLNTKGKSPRERKELASYLTEAEECINNALSLTSKENTPHHFASQNRQLGYIHFQLCTIRKSTSKDVIDYYDKARDCNPDIHINEALVPADYRNRYKK